MNKSKDKDKGRHYRFTYRTKISKKAKKLGYVEVKLDPFRISAVYKHLSFPLATVLKKILVAGNRGSKSYKEDITDCICALERELEMLKEDDYEERN